MKVKSNSKNKDTSVPEKEKYNKLAFRNRLISNSKTTNYPVLPPAKCLTKSHGQDIKKKGGHRKAKYLFSFPGMLAPLASESGGQLGTIDKMDTDNPVLYIDFPQGRLKMIGSILYPKNRYLTLQCHKLGKSVLCEDVFDTMVTFPEVFWIGTSEENPNEEPLGIPDFLKSTSKEIKESLYNRGCGDYTNNCPNPSPSPSGSSIVISGDDDEDCTILETKLSKPPVKKMKRETNELETKGISNIKAKPSTSISSDIEEDCITIENKLSKVPSKRKRTEIKPLKDVKNTQKEKNKSLHSGKRKQSIRASSRRGSMSGKISYKESSDKESEKEADDDDEEEEESDNDSDYE